MTENIVERGGVDGDRDRERQNEGGRDSERQKERDRDMDRQR